MMGVAGSETYRRPLKPVTTAQLQALHAIARRRGLSHVELRAAGGVESLKELSAAEASRLIDRLQTKDHRSDWTPAEPNRASARGVIRNATDRQRTYIVALMEQLGWGAEKATGWLRERHEIRDLARGVFSARVASEAIYQLEQALLKARRRAAAQGAHETV